MSEPDAPTLTAAHKAELAKWAQWGSLAQLDELVAGWLAEARAEGWNEALRWVRQQADVTSPEYVLDRIDRAEPFNPYRSTP